MEKKLIMILILLIGITIFTRIGFSFFNTPFLDGESQLAILPALNIIHGTGGFGPNGEAHLLTYIILIPYFLSLQSITIYESVWILKSIITIISCLMVFGIVKDITKSNRLGLLGIVLMMIQSTALVAQGILIYNGDLFTATFAVLAIWLLVKYQAERKISLLMASFGVLLFSYLIWNGGKAALVVYGLAFVALVLWKKMSRQRLLLLMFGIILILWIVAFTQTIPNYGNPPISNVNTSEHWSFWCPLSAICPNYLYRISLNIVSFLTQGVGIFPIWPYEAALIVSGALLYFGPIIYAIYKKELLENKMFFCMLIMTIALGPIALTNSRFESMVFLPICLLAASGIRYEMKFWTKSQFRAHLFLVLIFFVFMFAIFSCWLIKGLE